MVYGRLAIVVLGLQVKPSWKQVLIKNMHCRQSLWAVIIDRFSVVNMSRDTTKPAK